MDIELLGIWIDSIVALTAIAGVIVAAQLGRKAVAVARETVDRSEKDYAGVRLDMVHEWHGTVTQIMAEIKADLHIFWKEDPEVLLANNPSSSRAAELIKHRQDAEIAVHRDMYRLSGAAERLSKAVGAARINTSSGTVPEQGISESVRTAIRVYERSAMTLYLALVVSDTKFPGPRTDASAFVDEFVYQLLHDSEERSVRDSVRSWLEAHLESQAISQLTPEIIAINFVEGYAQRELDAAIESLTDPLFDVCVAKTSLDVVKRA